jgi:hypothetical protein
MVHDCSLINGEGVSSWIAQSVSQVTGSSPVQAAHFSHPLAFGPQ